MITYTDSVRRLIGDGALAGQAAYNMVRLEDLSDQIAALATPVGTTFLVRFSQLPTENFVTAYAIAGSLVAYVDGSPSPVTPTSDVNANGNFTLAVAPVSQLQVTYAWQYFQDADVADFVDQARGWLAQPTLAGTPDGLATALVQYAASLALYAMSRRCALADVHAGDAGSQLSQLAAAYSKDAAALYADAIQARDSFYVGAGSRRTPAGAIASIGLDPYQPKR
jgi:hypothetical protein